MPRKSDHPGSQEPDLSFENALERLESLITRLERGGLELEEALEAFEEGVRLTRRCGGQLEQAERRIEELVEEGGEWLRRSFEDLEESE